MVRSCRGAAGRAAAGLPASRPVRLLALAFLLALAHGWSAGAAAAGGGEEAVTVAADLRLTILYDNSPGPDGLTGGWGFACLVQAGAATVLFDTGPDGAALRRNAGALGASLDRLDALVLSHEHWDHVGGVGEVLAARPGLRVLGLASFPEPLREAIAGGGGALIDGEEPQRVAPGLRTTGRLQGEAGPPEQALILETPRGAVVITGCAHPGVVEIVERARAVTGGEVLAVLGGFHLGRADDDAVRGIVARLKALGVRRAGPCHCSGQRARELFAAAFGADYLDLHTGSVLALADLAPGGDGK
jgi:7,8-dihydropterin-6-yl-methyl-4-(beta-D-ribofuranosyl)aminobenzene 5'-phosphate synthase